MPSAPKMQPVLSDALEAQVDWSRTGDPEFPFEASIASRSWRIRINDFPEQPLFTLLVDGTEVGDIEEWPEPWSRPARGEA